MSTASDRRAPGATRIPFDAMVEVGGALGPSFEARALNLSEEGMSLRTAYLPEIGQPISCRFDAGEGLSVMATGEVLWKEDMGDGGEFGIRFTNLDAESVEALHRILGAQAADPLGRKVRLHIEGLASPMRARVKSAEGVCVTAYSELGFLQVGSGLELEDAMSGTRRAALIDRVEVEVDRDSHIPHLVVTLRYDDEEARHHAMAMAPTMTSEHEQHEQHEQHEEEEPMMKSDETTGRDEGHVMEEEGLQASTGAAEMIPAEAEAKAPAEDEESSKMKSAFARGALKARDQATVAFHDWSKKAKTTVAMLVAKAKKKREDAAAPAVRRTTAPPPGGALHAAGRKVVRGEIEEAKEFDPTPAGLPKFKITKKKMAIAGAVTVATVLAIVAVKKPAAPPAAAATTTTAADTAAVAANATPAPTHATTAAIPMPAPTNVGVNDPLAAQAAGMDPAGMTDTGSKHGKPQPFGNGTVGAHGNTLKLKMDGSIDRIQGASQPTGFTVMLPGRKSLESAAPLASKDDRIAAIKVENGPSGAELTVTFKDGVPGYQVRAKGDTLEMVLAKAPGATADHNADAKPKHKKHKKH